MSDFVHLHVHTIYSQLDGVATPDDYFDECVKRNYVAIALTEHGNLASIPDAYLASKRTNVKYIVGSEVYYNDLELHRQKLECDGTSMRTLSDDEKSRLTKHRHLTILCKNVKGYENLLKIRMDAFNNGFYRKPRSSFEMIKKYRDNLIILSGCMNGPISFEIQEYIKKKERCHDESTYNQYLMNAIRLAKQFKELFEDDFYIELQMPGIEHDVEIFKWLVHIAKLLNIKCVITNDAHYINEEDYNLQRIMMAIDQNVTIYSEDLFISDSTSGYFKTRENLRDTFTNTYMSNDVVLADFELACDHTLEIADKCEIFKPNLDLKLPQYTDADRILTQLVAQALIEKNLHMDKEYVERSQFELERIKEKEFSSYFLICRDLVLQSTDVLNMPVGPRGSAGGSLVCYLIGIHFIDPIKFNLSFDRFLSSSRGGKMLKIYMTDDEEQ